MNPGVERAITAILPQRTAVSLMACATSGAVARPLTTSTSFMRVGGLKKCMPTTRSGRASGAAMAVIDSEDVLVARIA